MPQTKVGSVRVPHPFAGRRQVLLPALPLDLHVLSLPLAFILSQDQTLHCKWIVWNWLMFSNVNFRKINRFIVLFSLWCHNLHRDPFLLNRTSSVHAVAFCFSQSLKELRQPALTLLMHRSWTHSAAFNRSPFYYLCKNFLLPFCYPFFSNGVQRYRLLSTPQNCFWFYFQKLCRTLSTQLLKNFYPLKQTRDNSLFSFWERKDRVVYWESK